MSGKCGDVFLGGLSGWRRSCLLFTLGLLLVVVVINLGLTLWMLQIMRFSSNGLGAMKVIPGGLQLRSQTLVQDKLISTKVGSRKGQPVLVESSQKISLMTTSSDGRVNSKLSLGEDSLDMTASSVKIADPVGKPLFSTDKREVMIGAISMRVSGDGGTVVHGSIQTPLVRPEAGQNLTLESPTKSLNAFALHGVSVESRAGDITAHAHGEFKLQSKAGVLRLEAPDIYMSKLQLPIPTKQSSIYTSSRSGPKPEVFQVCLCGKGRLFLAPAEGPCVADNDVCR